ncbi:transposase [Lewinella sp. W8]|uniref:transposase n=1 Tax=Lewinella sp. W8 TaxID=2528208 RepID=UPI00106795AA|nr:transposase [Lewinella sp. W8]MTB50507.1 transposase [Lewinella sp. W8]
MSKMRKQFTKEERLEIVQQSFEPDVKVADVAAKFGIGANTLSRWRRQFRQEHGIVPEGQGIKVMTDEERRIAQLEKQLREAQLERDILKKAISIFSKGDGKYSNL